MTGIWTPDEVHEAMHDVDKLLNPEDGLFVRDTLRFFEVTEPTTR